MEGLLSMILSVHVPDLGDVGVPGVAELEVGEGDGGGGEVAAAAAARAAVQPALVTAHVPQREHGHDVVQVVPEVCYVLTQKYLAYLAR